MSEIERLELAIREQKLEKEYAQALIDAVLDMSQNEYAHIYPSAIEVEGYSHTHFDGTELILRIAALTDSQRIDTALTVLAHAVSLRSLM